MRRKLSIEIFFLTFFIGGFLRADVKEALKFARDGVEKAVELAPKVNKRKSFDSRGFTGTEKILYKVSMRRDSTKGIIIKSTGYSDLDEVSIEMLLSRFEKIEKLSSLLLKVWSLVHKKGFIKGKRKTDRVETKINDYRVEISVRFEGNEASDIKIAKIKIKVWHSEIEPEIATIEALRRYRVSEGVFF